ncbi:MAG: class I SAM-dependent DNA methyltransferase [Planctomycetales bacterium]|nr:class I SAM-dependent DNA methyltransferase [Planctomycetales bacterium]
MNAVEIEEAVSKLVEEPFDAAEFSYAFLEAFGNKSATLQRLRSVGKNSTNKTDVAGEGIQAVLQRNNIHIATCVAGGPDAVASLLKRLVDSPASSKHKAKFALATDGNTVHAECLNSEEPPLVCEFKELADHFGYFLELAGISTVRQIRENAFDIKATGRLNRLYVELLRNNPDWDGDERREELNHFFARLIFCFFAEDTGIFNGNALFTETVRQMSDPSGENTDFVLSEIFRAMDVPMKARDAAKLRPWAGQFPYVNGGLFGSNGSTSERGTVPKFTQIARSYLLHIGSLDWTQINPDIFGSMIQAVADDEERGALGMHYTSVPNILKVLNPLFLDDLHAQLKEAGKNPRKLLNLRKRLARIRVFDPACGSGNFLVIAYKEMRKIEAEINILRGEPDRASEIPLTNFRGIELRHFAVEIARLALIIAEYQCDELYRGQRLALAEFLPLNKENWITHGNALRLDWLKVCPPTGKGGVKLVEDDLFQTPLDQTEIDFENEGGETYICGNPPYLGSTWQTKTQKDDLQQVFASRTSQWKSLDYVAGWFMKAVEYGQATETVTAFVATNSICQGQQVSLLWPLIQKHSHQIAFAHTSFKWANLASHNAGVTVIIVGLAKSLARPKVLYSIGDNGEDNARVVANINAYLVPAEDVIVEKRREPVSRVAKVDAGGKPVDGGHLLLTAENKRRLQQDAPAASEFLLRVYGADEYTNGKIRYCLWISDAHVDRARSIPAVASRIASVAEMRSKSPKAATRKASQYPHRFDEVTQSGSERIAVIPKLTSENREYIPAGLLAPGSIITDLAFAVYEPSLTDIALLNSKLHFVWIATVCGKFKTDYRFSNVLGWNTFPVPPLTEENIVQLTRCSENILLARESHWPATIAELYDPAKMPVDLRAAHDRNDETLERIYIGRRFKNDTERLETLFQLYTEMTGKEKGKK